MAGSLDRRGERVAQVPIDLGIQREANMTAAHFDILRVVIAAERMRMAHDTIIAGVYCGHRN